jgi:hypothetical protein
MGHGSARCSANIQHFAARLHVDVIATTADASSELRSEGVPGTVLNFLAIGLLNAKKNKQGL